MTLSLSPILPIKSIKNAETNATIIAIVKRASNNVISIVS
jgi:hypothetical protein